MERRSFLIGGSTIVLSELLAGCNSDGKVSFSVELLKGSIPPQVVNEFSKIWQQKAQLKFAPVAQLQGMYEHLQNLQKPQNANQKKGWSFPNPFGQGEKNNIVDLVTLGDFWLQAAIEQKLIKPLDIGQLKQWSSLPPIWQELVTRNDQGFIDNKGKVWAAPYRWGSTVIVYRRDKFQQLGLEEPKDWGDLFRSELKGRISLLNQPREVIGLVLKKMGKSYNTEKLNEVQDLEKELKELSKQVKFYSNERYLEPLIIGDTWLAVGWSNDVFPELPSHPQLKAVIPQSGTAIWADLWVHPALSNKIDISSEWMNFCWQEKTAQQITILTKSNSPIKAKIANSDIPESLQKLLVINPDVLAKSEFMRPFAKEVNQKYEDLFKKVKG